MSLLIHRACPKKKTHQKTTKTRRKFCWGTRFHFASAAVAGASVIMQCSKLDVWFKAPNCPLGGGVNVFLLGSYISITDCKEKLNLTKRRGGRDKWRKEPDGWRSEKGKQWQRRRKTRVRRPAGWVGKQGGYWRICAACWVDELRETLPWLIPHSPVIILLPCFLMRLCVCVCARALLFLHVTLIQQTWWHMTNVNVYETVMTWLVYVQTGV